jgi:3-deoxy-D-manno-octulosonic-acid transferase
VVPRHPQRFDEVAQFAQGRRSREDKVLEQHQVYLGDTMGEMAFYYGACDVALIGGSFVPVGGQNLIEALAAGAPVVFGPSMFNFAEASRLALDAGAAIQVEGPGAAIRLAHALLADSARRATMCVAGKNLCALHRGATRKHLEVLKVLRRR